LAVLNRRQIARPQKSSRKAQAPAAKTTRALTQRQRAKIQQQRAERREIGNGLSGGALLRGRLNWHAVDRYSDIIIPKEKVTSLKDIKIGDILLMDYDGKHTEIGKYVGKGIVESHHEERNRREPYREGTTEIEFYYHLADAKIDLNWLLTRPNITIKKIQIKTRKGPLPK
jgi:hypothetical protein